jgi:hypothetical protein
MMQMVTTSGGLRKDTNNVLGCLNVLLWTTAYNQPFVIGERNCDNPGMLDAITDCVGVPS